jgi:hypothetical protein
MYKAHSVTEYEYEHMPEEFKGGTYVDGFRNWGSGDYIIVTRHEDERDWEADFRELAGLTVIGDTGCEIPAKDLVADLKGVEHLKQMARTRLALGLLDSLTRMGGVEITEERMKDGGVRLSAEMFTVIDHKRFRELTERLDLQKRRIEHD